MNMLKVAFGQHEYTEDIGWESNKNVVVSGRNVFLLMDTSENPGISLGVVIYIEQSS